MKLAAAPDYVRVVPAAREVWVTEPSRKQIEVFRADAGGTLSHVTNIAVPDGPESLVIDARRRRAYSHTWTDQSFAIDLETHKLLSTWPNGCRQSRGIALDEKRGLLFAGCAEGKATVVDLRTSKVVSTADAGADIDSIGFGATLGHLYVPGGGSADLSIFGVSSAGKLTLLGKAATAADAHTVAFDPVTRTRVRGRARARHGAGDPRSVPVEPRMRRPRAATGARRGRGGGASAALAPARAWAYRPFDQTDAEVVEVDGVELELGPFAVSHRPGHIVRARVRRQLRSHAAAGAGRGGPQSHPGRASSDTPQTSQTAPSVLLKGVLREGVLQEHTGPSVALEVGVLLPVLPAPDGFGASSTLIVSERWPATTIHLNVQVDLSRDHHLDALGGAIVEGPHTWRICPVGEAYVEHEGPEAAPSCPRWAARSGSCARTYPSTRRRARPVRMRWRSWSCASG